MIFQHSPTASRLLRLFVILAFQPSLLVLAQNQTLIDTGSVWRWRKGTNEVSAPVSAWRSLGFNDSSWPTGTAPFHYGTNSLGGDDNVFTGTILTGMRYTYSCVFLRQTFVITNLPEVVLLSLTATYDDGFVAWVNGVEVARNRVNGEPLYTTVASASIEPATVATFPIAVLPGNFLVPGTNVLAVQAFNASRSGSDFRFDAALRATRSSDIEPPTIAGLSPAPDAVVSALTQITVNFSEPVLGVDAADLLVNGQPAAMVSPGAGSNSFVFTFTQPPPGEVGLEWDPAPDITDLTGNRFVPTNVWSYTLRDTLAPEVSSLAPVAGSLVGRLTQVEVQFSEPVLGLDAADLLINDIPAASVTGSGAGPYIFSFPQPSAGTVQFTWAAGHNITDAAESPNAFYGGGWMVTLNPGAPAGGVIINEFLAGNLSGLRDEDGELQDWIELYNRGTNAVNLLGWSLSDDRSVPDKWTFPSRILNPGQYLVVFASEKDRRAPVGANRFHTNFKLNAFGEYLALFPPDYPRTAASEFSPEFPVQRNDYSYGLDSSNAWRYFQVPTPGTVNGISTITGVAPPPHFSVGHGLFNAPFKLLLTAPSAGAVIRYTTDGSEPTATNGFNYTAPLSITNTTVLRAATYLSNQLPSATITRTYLFLADMLSQSNTPPGYPSTWGTSTAGGFRGNLVPADYEMDPEIVNDPAYGPELAASLRSLPTVSIAIDVDDMFGAADGIYSHTSESAGVYRGQAWERPCSVEFIPTNGSGGFQVDCGIRIQGNASRAPQKTPKHPFRLFFKGDYGPGRLDYRVYPDSPVTSFNTLVLRADFNNSWLHWNANQRLRGSRIRDGWTKETWRDMGEAGGHTRYFHLYINGLYWGIYDFGERIDATFAANYYGGEPEDYDAIASKPVAAVDGDLTAYNAMIAAVRYPDMRILGNYTLARQYLDMPNFIDYMLLNFYGGNEDWGLNSNWNAVRCRGPGETFKYITWDGEQLVANLYTDRVNGGNLPSGLHENLVNSPEYRLAFADRVQKHLFNGGALSTNAVTQRWLKHAAQVDLAMIAESARWGDYRRDVHPYSSGPYELYTHDGFWVPEINRIVTSYFPQRTAIFLQQLRNAGLYPNVDAPSFSQLGGPVAAGFPLVIIAPAGIIYCTTNGADPRVYGTGEVAPEAFAYNGAVPLNTSVAVKARALVAGTWSALTEAAFIVTQLGVPLRITEINYHPVGGDAYEFVEVQNTSRLPLDVGGFSFEGISYVFPEGTTMAPNAILVLGSSADPQAFATRYPTVAVFDTFGGSLSNGGERLAIRDRDGAVIASVEYEDHDGWPATADGGGYSLEVIDPLGDPNAPANWRASEVANGTPGLAPATPLPGNVVLNEIMAENRSTVTNGGTLPDWVELHNTGTSTVNLADWSLSDDSDPRKFVFPNKTLAPDDYLVVWCDSDVAAPGLHTGFALGRKGDSVFLYDANTNRVDAISFGLQLPDFSVGRLHSLWQLTLPTPGAANLAAALASPTNLAINEWLANAPPGGSDWLELYNRSSNAPVSLHGLYFETSNALCQLLSLSFLPPHGYVRLTADEEAGSDHLGFKLPAAGGAITLYSETAERLDAVTYGSQAENVSQGRLPDGADTIVTFNGSASPGASNYVLAWSGPVLSEVLARNQRAVVAPWGGCADFVELYNPGGSAFSLGNMALGRSLGGSGRWVFPAGTFIAAGGYVRVWCDGSRAPSSKAGSDLNAGFSLDGDNGDIYLFNAAGQPVDWVGYGFQLPDLSIGRSLGAWRLMASPTPGAANSAPAILGDAASIRFNEWMANATDGDDWFELYNANALPVDLGGLYLSDDPSIIGTTNFQIAPLSFIEGRHWVKWLADGDTSAGRNHTGFALDFLGETLRLYDTNLVLLDAVDFGIQAEGVSEGRLPDGSTNIVSFPATPTPDESNYLPLTNLVINEVLTHTDPPFEDAIELYNPTAGTIDIGGWYLSDSPSDPERFRIPDGTSIAGGGYRVLYQNQFGPADGETDTPPLFSFNSAHGDSALLSQADSDGNLTGYRVGVSFGAAANGVSFGRYPTSVGADFTALSQHTFGEDAPIDVTQFRDGTGLSNAYPLVGPVVVNEIMYHPSPSSTNTAENPSEEFIELYNLSPAAVPLYDPAHPTNAWRLDGAVRFEFPTNTSIEAGGFLLVLPFDPTTNSPALADFLTKYGTNGILVGPYSGKLDNAGESIELYRPDTPQAPPHPDAGFVPYILVDRVVYSDQAPWPAAADGGGASLQRIVPADYGNDPANWIAAPPNAGCANPAATSEAPTILTPLQSRTVAVGGRVEFKAAVAGTPPLGYQWRFNDVPLAGQTATNLLLVNLQEANSGAYSVLVTNAAGWTLGGPAILAVVAPTLAVPQITPDGDFAFLLTGATNSVYSVETSTNLADWLEVGVLNLTNAPVWIVYPTGPGPGPRFYRTRIVE